MKKFSKLMAVLLALVMCLSLMPMAAFAEEVDAEPQVEEMVEALSAAKAAGEDCGIGKHNWQYVTTKEPTCTEWGEKVSRCTKCGKDQPGIIPMPVVPNGHDWEFVSCAKKVYTSLCSESHIDLMRCKTCGEQEERLNSAGHSHNWVVTRDAVDLGAIGSYDTNTHHTVKCTQCTAVEVWSHSFTLATCTAPETCACGKVKLNSKPLGHNPVEVDADPATCQKAGTTAGTKCSTCDTILSGVEADPKKDHNFTGEYVQGTTGTGSAGHAQKCVYGCGEHSIFVPHTGEWTVVDEPTCTVEGSKTFECTACGYTASQKIPATGHKDEDGDKKCDDCDADLNCQHEWEWQNTYEATCTNIGYKVEYCAKCDTSQVIKTADKLNHDFQDTENTVDTATCTQAGEKTQYCSRCDATQNVETKVLGHKYGELQAEIPATCLEDGTQAHYECVRCHKLFTTGTTAYDSVEELKIAAPGSHAWDAGVVTTPAGETTEGVRTFTCTRTGCGATRTEAIPATGGTGGGDTGDGTGGGEEIEEPDVPLVGGPDDGEMLIDEPEVPLAGLMTRAEFVNYLYVQAGAPEAQASTFTDVPEDHEYAAAIGWAQANGIAKGITEDEFAPDEIVSVEQAELFLLRYAQFKGVEMPELAALAGKDPLEILDNADEVLAEFFEAIRPQSQAA